jgi:hypothetical protein
MNVCVVITVAMVMLLRDFWALWDDTYYYVTIHPWPTMYTYLFSTQHSHMT